MTQMTVRGVPRGLQRDAWWMAADSQTGVGRGETIAEPRPFWLLIGLLVVVDFLIFATSPGIGFALAIVMLAGATHWLMRGDADRSRAIWAWGVLAVSLIPAFDLVQFTSVAIAMLGLAGFAVMISGDRWSAALLRLPIAGADQTVADLRAPRIKAPGVGLLLDWALPAVVGLVFAGLLIVANPIVEGWMQGVEFLNPPDATRVIMWVVSAILIWPLLRLAKLKLHTSVPKQRTKSISSSTSFVNVRSVMRALVLFNAIFAAQTAMDLGYLWGGFSLPDGMNYATYAHRGAYPLMATALLAGGFALIAQPWLSGRLMRILLMVWIGQTMLLVLSSILRLDLYVDVYGLTHLRFAAFIWMAVVALGLVVLMLQIVWGKSAGWMLSRAFAIGYLAVYVCSLVNVTGFVARQQLTTGPLDIYYVCQLGEGAVPVVAKLSRGLCGQYDLFDLDQPDDWREWGFRNARLRRSLTTATAEAYQ